MGALTKDFEFSALAHVAGSDSNSLLFVYWKWDSMVAYIWRGRDARNSLE